MKKMLIGVLAAALLLCVAAAAAGPARGRNYIDADGDGVCDNWSGCGYTDANGDGICDNWPGTAGCHRGTGSGCGLGRSCRR